MAEFFECFGIDIYRRYLRALAQEKLHPARPIPEAAAVTATSLFARRIFISSRWYFSLHRRQENARCADNGGARFKIAIQRLDSVFSSPSTGFETAIRGCPADVTICIDPDHAGADA